MKTFNNPSMCYMGPGGSPPTPYEPTPYATTQLIQSNIMSKNSGAGPGDFCDKRWKPQQPKPPELPSQLQFNVIEQNRLNKGKCWTEYIRMYSFSFKVLLWPYYVSCILLEIYCSWILRSLQRRWGWFACHYSLQPGKWAQLCRVLPQLWQSQQQHLGYDASTHTITATMWAVG